MSFATKIAAMRVNYHANLVDFWNGVNQLHLISDEKAEELCKRHTIAALEAGARKHGMSLEQALEMINKEES